ncbi:MAG: hypothetical protein C0596_02575 [Marinilabiliales bacterium]|nr:MAG: hypothetical protein C0596_02575 [Marinilabiliales bacterium]
MNYLSQYIVQFHGLDKNEHRFNFTVNDEFFEYFEDGIIKGGDFDVIMILIKKTGSLHLNISLKGSVQIVCDRCLELYKQDIDFEDTVSVEFGDETNFDTNSECVILDKNKSEINISQFIYEFANFALPLQHYHPDDENGNSGCNVEMLELLNKHLIKEEEKTDPRWDALKELKK